MSKTKDNRKKNQRLAFYDNNFVKCVKCDGKGKHFVLPSLGEEGFWACDAFNRLDE